MVGGRLRCLGSLTKLKAKFGDGYQIDLKLQAPEEATQQKQLQNLQHAQMGAGVRFDQVSDHSA